ncbi:MAG: penicillin-binding protein [Acidobacteriota bacterium]
MSRRPAEVLAVLTKWLFGRRGAPARHGRFTALARALRTRPATLDLLRSGDRPSSKFESSWRQSVKRRLFVVLSVLAVWGVGIEARLFWLQVLQHDALSAQAARHQQKMITPEALRGDIVDRNGNILAYSVEADSIAADPSQIKDASHAAGALCTALRDCTAKELRELATKLGSDTQFVYVRRSRAVSPEQVQRVAALKLPGIVLRTDTRRYYPRYELAAHLLGFVDIDNKGQAGVEYAFDKVVRGEDGLAFAQVDARRQRLDTRVERAPVPGATVELTIDLYLQHIVERELKAGVEANRAEGGTAIVMDPHTGEILALASYPTFNPNAVSDYRAASRVNRAIQEVYEPGSTFKIVTASAALDEGIVKPTDLIDTNPGYYKVRGRKPINDTHHYGILSFEDVIVKSSNVGAIKVGMRVGADRLTRYVNRFGFGQALAPDMVGQSRGLWNPKDLNESGLASVSMGYQVSVTPLQMATATSSVANGGLLMEPHIVRAIVRGGQREVVAPKVLRRTITAETAATLTSIMEGVTERGTATAARMDEYQVAGKTGTAHKVVDGRYSNSEYNASFVGFVPSRQPAFTVLVVIDTPRSSAGYYGGTVAAPIFKRIAEAALQQVGVPRTINPTPALIVADGAGMPAMTSTHEAPPTLTPIGGPALMPNVRGLSARDAVRMLGSVGMSARVTGTGFVMQQSPEPGAPVDRGGSGSITLQRTPGDQAAAIIVPGVARASSAAVTQ